MTEKTLQVALCDDTPLEAQLLGELLDEYDKAPLVRDWYQSAEDLEAALAAGKAYDLCLLDIVLPGMDGLEFLRRQRSAGNALRVAYLSASQEYAREATALGAVAYLVKPVRAGQLHILLEKIRHKKAQQARETLEIATATGLLRIALADILWAQCQKDGCQLYLAGGQVVNVPDGPPLQANLLARRGFMAVGKRQIVNLGQVESVLPRQFILRDKSSVKIPWLRYKQAAAAYMAFLAEGGPP